MKRIITLLPPVGFIYLVELTQFRTEKILRIAKNKTHDSIYKIGRTRQENYNRLASYPKGSRLLLHLEVSNYVMAERELKIIFKQKFEHSPEYGTEYFWGNGKEMMSVIWNYEFKKEE
jgi:hypothetical protein